MTGKADPLLERVKECGCVAVIGTAKNAGKTETLNFLISSLGPELRLGVTSIGLDGEKTDIVTSTPKPEIRIFPGMFFTTTASHYLSSRLGAAVLDLDKAGRGETRMMTGRCETEGKIILAGPSDTPSMRRKIELMHTFGAEVVIVDGALSRKSPANPSVADGMILATGASSSRTIKGIADELSFLLALIGLPIASNAGKCKKEDNTLTLTSGLDLKTIRQNPDAKTIRVEGAVTDTLLRCAAQTAQGAAPMVVASDFTRFFITPAGKREFEASGGGLAVESKTRLLGITCNPVSPDGFRLDSRALVTALQERAGDVPVLDIRNN